MNLVEKFNPNHDPGTGEFSEGDGGGGGGTGGGASPSGSGKVSYSDKERADLNVFGFTKDQKQYDALRSSEAFGKTLAKLPRVEGTFYRGMALKTQKEADQFAVDSIATFDKHSFATPSKATAKSYADLQIIKDSKSIPIILTIKNAKAADYTHSGLNQYTSGLKEVVFSMGNKIKVTSRKETVINGAKGYLVTAEQVK